MWKATKEGHDHRRKDGSIRHCDLDFAHLVGEGPPLAWCNHGKLDPDNGYCVHSGAAGANGIRVGTRCSDPFNAQGV